MSLINVSITKDQNGFPTQAVLNRNGRTLNVTYNPDGLISFQGRMHEDFKPILQMIWPFDREIEIKEPLLTKLASPDENIILFDDFEGLLKWGTGVNVVIDNANAFNGNNSLGITCPAASAGEYAIRYFTAYTSNKLKLQLHAKIADWSKTDYFEMGIIVYTTNEIKTTYIRYNPNVFQVYVFGDAYQTFFTMPSPLLDTTVVEGSWHKLSFSADFETNRYDYFQVGNKRIALNTYEMQHADSAGSDLYGAIVFRVVRVAAQDGVCNIDDVKLTEIE